MNVVLPVEVLVQARRIADNLESHCDANWISGVFFRHQRRHAAGRPGGCGRSLRCLEETAAALGVGARLEMRKVSRGGLAATKVDVITPEELASETEHSHGCVRTSTQRMNIRMSMHVHAHRIHMPPHRSLSAILEIIRRRAAFRDRESSARSAPSNCWARLKRPSIPSPSKRFISTRWARWTPSSISSAPPRALRRSASTAGSLRRSMWAAERSFASTARFPFPRRPRWLCWAMRRSTRPASRWSA